MTTQVTAAGKIVFADQLRGLAAMMVVINHYTGVYWFMPAVVAQFVFSPPLTAPVPALATAIVNVPFNPGALGVSIFFLISGFVIPFSFRHHGRVSFLVARALRIYPTYWAALAVGLAARYLSLRYWGQHFSVERWTIIANALLIQDLAGIPSMDLVNWTLAIEVKFYLLLALTHLLVPRWRAWLVLGAGVAAVAINVAAVWLLPHLSAYGQGLSTSVGNETMCIAFMMLGTLFFMHLRGLLSRAGLAASSIAGLALFQACWAYGTMSQQFPLISNNYIYGWLIFALCFLARGWFVRIAALRWLSEISYPLYLVHPMAGYAVMTFLISGLGLGYALSAGVALATAMALAYLVNRLVEAPSIAMGRAIGSAHARPDEPVRMAAGQ